MKQFNTDQWLRWTMNSGLDSKQFNTLILTGRQFFASVVLLFAVLPFTISQADLTELSYANDVETAAAIANQATFDVLNEACNANGLFDRESNPTFSNALVGNGCTPENFFIFVNTRELVHTSNELTGNGPTIASLGLDQEGLGLALRWTAAEEFAAQSSMATDFANGQLSNLASRMTALRFGSRGFSALNMPINSSDDIMVAGRQQPRQRGGGASSDEGETYSPWGGFMDGAFGYGGKDPTALEDAFDFDGTEITLGIDYRFDNNFVVGGVAGYSEQVVDFDEAASEISVVAGEIKSDGYSFIAFGLYQGEHLAASASLGYQSLDYASERRIKYPSFNPNIGNANSAASSSPSASAILASFNIGYALYWQRFTIEPYFNGQFIDVTIDRFDETRSVNSFSGDQDNRSFDLTIEEQKFDSFDAALGLKLQTVFTPSFAVLVPYISFEGHKESQDDSRIITAQYANLGALSTSGTGFRVPTDVRDDSYTRLSVGMSMVLRGGRQLEVDGAIGGGLMGYVQYSSIGGLDNFDDQVIAGGFRYEF